MFNMFRLSETSQQVPLTRVWWLLCTTRTTIVNRNQSVGPAVSNPLEYVTAKISVSPGLVLPQSLRKVYRMTLGSVPRKEEPETWLPCGIRIRSNG